MSKASRASRAWSEREVRLTVLDYLEMFEFDLAGRPYVKADHNRRLVSRLDGRSSTAVERKHMNVSAVLRHLGLAFIPGYKPLSNYQDLLREVVEQELESRSSLIDLIERVASAMPSTIPSVDIDPDDDEQLSLKPPERELRRDMYREKSREPAMTKFDYAKRDAENRLLGKMGEEFVFGLERARLARRGREDLARKVVWVSRDRGDGLGYDIESFDHSGAPAFIEVKTTNQAPRDFPFYVSRNELLFSREQAPSYQLHRLFNFTAGRRRFILTGDISNSCLLDPVLYRAGF